MALFSLARFPLFRFTSTTGIQPEKPRALPKNPHRTMADAQATTKTTTVTSACGHTDSADPLAYIAVETSVETTPVPPASDPAVSAESGAPRPIPSTTESPDPHLLVEALAAHYASSSAYAPDTSPRAPSQNTIVPHSTVPSAVRQGRMAQVRAAFAGVLPGWRTPGRAAFFVERGITAVTLLVLFGLLAAHSTALQRAATSARDVQMHCHFGSMPDGGVTQDAFEPQKACPWRSHWVWQRIRLLWAVLPAKDSTVAAAPSSDATCACTCGDSVTTSVLKGRIVYEHTGDTYTCMCPSCPAVSSTTVDTSAHSDLFGRLHWWLAMLGITIGCMWLAQWAVALAALVGTHMGVGA